MGTCCGYVNQKQDKDKTLYMNGGNREREIQEALDNLNEEQDLHQIQRKLHEKGDDLGETSSQRSQLNNSQHNPLHSLIQNHGTMDPDEDRFKKEPFYISEGLGDFRQSQTVNEVSGGIVYEEVVAVAETEKLVEEVKEQKKLTFLAQNQVRDMERKKSEIVVVKQETLQAMNPKEKEELIRRASQQFDQQTTLIKLQQQQLFQQQQLLEKQQQLLQQTAALTKSPQNRPKSPQQIAPNGIVLNPLLNGQSQQAQASKQTNPKSPQNLAPINIPVVVPPLTLNNNTLNIIEAQDNKSTKPPLNASSQQPSANQMALPPHRKISSSSAQSSPQSKSKNNENPSFDTDSVHSVDRPRSIMKIKKTNQSSGLDNNTSFDSEVGSQASAAKKKVKFKESVFKKSQKKKKSGY